MADNRIAEKSAADKRKALLALATGEEEHPGPCLSPAEMAGFVAGTCSEEEKRQALRHVSLCKLCYGEWLVLAGMEMERRRGKRRGERIPFYLRPANLAALVSAMAAVICVGLFLDINPFDHRIEPGSDSAAPRQERMAPAQMPAAPAASSTPAARPPLPDRSAEKQVQPQPLPSADTADDAMPSESRPADTAVQQDAPVASPPAPAVAPEQTARQAQEERSFAAPPPQAPPERSSPEPAAAKRAAGASISAADDADKGMAGAPARVAPEDEWADKLLSACRSEQLSGRAGENRQMLFKAGKDSLRLWLDRQRGAAGTSPRLSSLLRILEQANDADELFARCPEMLAAAGEGR